MDFGAGVKACHAKQMSDLGFNVVAYDFGENVTSFHGVNALHRKYDTVFASNVLNVQSTQKMLEETLKQMWNAVKVGGRLVVNYPTSPRYVSLTTKEMDNLLRGKFKNIQRVEFKKYSLIWEIKKENSK